MSVTNVAGVMQSAAQRIEKYQNGKLRSISVFKDVMEMEKKICTKLQFLAIILTVHFISLK